MKRIIAITVLLSVLAGGFAAAQTYKDGVYFAQAKEFDKNNGWKGQVVVAVSGGKIVKVTWNGISNFSATDKKSWAAAGKYGMAKAAKLGEWDVQAGKLEAALVKAGSPDKLPVKKDGAADAVTGASMKATELVDLATQALAAAPVAKGSYAKDGWYFAEQADFDKTSGWKDNVLVTVVNGRVVDVLWNGVSADSAKKSKLIEAVTGKYGMGKAAKQGEWNVQAAKVEAAIVAAQDPAKIAVKKDGTTDAVAGASLKVKGVLDLAAIALKSAK
jgi:major membrane immunogen (membrane-anchored lipoprotein)